MRTQIVNQLARRFHFVIAGLLLARTRRTAVCTALRRCIVDVECAAHTWWQRNSAHSSLMPREVWEPLAPRRLFSESSTFNAAGLRLRANQRAWRWMGCLALLLSATIAPQNQAQAQSVVFSTTPYISRVDGVAVTPPTTLLRGQRVTIKLGLDASFYSTICVDVPVAPRYPAPGVAQSCAPAAETVELETIVPTNVPFDSQHEFAISVDGTYIASSPRVQVRRPECGITIVLHGFQLPDPAPFGEPCTTPGAYPPPPFMRLGELIAARAGRAAMWTYDFNEDRFLSYTPPGVPPYEVSRALGTGPENGEQIIVVNWCKASNTNNPGYGEAVAHALYGILKSYSPDGGSSGAPAPHGFGPSQSGFLRYGNALNVRIVAHSFGSGVGFQLLRRLRHLEGLTNLHFTTLDPHDFERTGGSYVEDLWVDVPNVDGTRLGGGGSGFNSSGQWLG